MKRKNGLTEKKIQQYEKEGRGQGEGNNYKPWIIIQDFPSVGLVTRSPGWTSRRLHQFLSTLERDFFYTQEWLDSVIDIREQYPLAREDTISIASKKGIKRPVDPSTEVPIVMTTDFLITVKTSSGRKFLARTIKPSKELENIRTLEKFEIERTYWEQRGIDWGIVTEQDLPKNIIANVEWLHSSYFQIGEVPLEALKAYFKKMETFVKKYDTTIIEMVTDFDSKFQLESGMGLEILKHMIARKKLKVDIQQKIYTHLWIKDVFT